MAIDFLGALSQGLRSAAAIRSPEVAAQIAQEDELRRQETLQQRKEKQTQQAQQMNQIKEAIQNGSMDAAAGNAQLKALGYTGPDITAGPLALERTQQLKTAQAAQEREQQYRTSLGQIDALRGQTNPQTGKPYTEEELGAQARAVHTKYAPVAELPKIVGAGASEQRTRELPLKGDMIQRQEWTGAGWQNIGEPYHRFGKSVVAVQSAQQPIIPAAAKNLVGEEFLNSLPTTDRSVVKQIGEGRSSFAELGIRGKERERYNKLVAQAYPDYDATKYATHRRAEVAFAVGKQGDAVRSFNVAVSHMDSLQKMGEALHNGDVKRLNQLANAWATETGQAAPNTFDAVKRVVGQEITKAIVGSAGGVEERKAAGESISRANSPAQLMDVIRGYQELMLGQLRGLKDQYVSTGGKPEWFDKKLSGRTLGMLRGESAAASGGSAALPPGFKPL